MVISSEHLSRLLPSSDPFLMNGLVCFTNCFLPQEDGTLILKDLWIDEKRGVILDAQKSFYGRRERPDRIIDLEGNILSPGLIDIQINGAYGFDFSVFDGDVAAYQDGMKLVAEKIVETGVTSLVPTIITQERSLYPKLLSLLRPFSTPVSANLLGWHAEGPFISMAKRGAHAPSYLMDAAGGFPAFETLYGPGNLADTEDWLVSVGLDEHHSAVRVMTAAPEVPGVMDAISTLTKRGIVFSIGHSIATSDIATRAVENGARLITHLFNAMPQLHHRDPSIIGLLGASPYLATPFSPIMAHGLFRRDTEHSKPPSRSASIKSPPKSPKPVSEAFDDIETPPQTPMFEATKETRSFTSAVSGAIPPLDLPEAATEKPEFIRPFYEMIVDGIHSHPNSVRLAYSAYPEGCILITDAMKILDPNLRDGVHEWRDGKRFVKEGDKLYLEGTTTLAGSVVTLDKCVRNFSKFTGCTLSEAIKCATYNPAKCLGIENRKGTLRSGADADLVVLDKTGNVISTWVKGRQVWAK